MSWNAKKIEDKLSLCALRRYIIQWFNISKVKV